jgi:Tfp pilus assembly PilM family ATPase
MQHVVPLVGQRAVVIDPGSRRLKLLVVESLLGRMRLLHRQTIDWQEEGLLTPDEVHHHFESILPEVGPHGVVMVLPQHRAMAQALDLPQTTTAEVSKLVEAEAVKMSGLSESGMLYDFVRLKPFGKYQSPVWVTLCQAREVWDHVSRFGRAPGDEVDVSADTQISEITTTAQALVAASRVLQPRPSEAVLVDLGANNTVVAVMVKGQSVFATSFPVGSNHFTEAIARLKGCPIEEAEAWKRAHNLFAGDHALPGFGKVVEEWFGELRRSVVEWSEDNPELELSLSAIPAFLCGGGACQEGLLDFLDGLGPMSFSTWPALAEDQADWPMEPYWVAYGAAMQALGKAPRAVSLLPEEMRAGRFKQLVWQRLQAANVLLLVLLFLALVFGTWKQAGLLMAKTRLEGQTREALHTAQNIDLMSRRLRAEFEKHRPVLQRQRQTLETLQALAAVQQVRSNRAFWYVLFADPASYFGGTAMPAGATNPPSPALSLFPTNSAPAQREFVAELCIPEEGEEMRRILNLVVSDLKRNPLFAKVDTLPAERKRNLVDPKVLITNRVFAVAMEFGSKEPAPPEAPEKPALPAPGRETKRTSPPLRLKAERPTAVPGATNR